MRTEVTASAFGRGTGGSCGLPVLTDAARDLDGPFRFRAQLPHGMPYTVQASTDLQVWRTLDMGIAESLNFEDAQAVELKYRFYRLLAGELHSANVIGYVHLDLPPGFSMIANPLDGACNSVGEIFKGWPEGTTLYKFNSALAQLSENAIKSGQWLNPAERVLPGEGVIIFNPRTESKSVCFVGEVMQGELCMRIPSGFSVRSSLIPQPGSLEELGFPLADGDVIHLFDRDQQRYVPHPYQRGQWIAGSPRVGPGESFWVAKTEPGHWTRTLLIA